MKWMGICIFISIGLLVVLEEEERKYIFCVSLTNHTKKGPHS